MILNEEMLDAAFMFRKAKPWQHIGSEDVFAVKLSNGEIGYCSIMGQGGEHFALGLYVGAKGFATLYKTISLGSSQPEEIFQEHLTFDCINCDFMNAADVLPDVKAVIKEYAASKGMKIPRPHGWPDFTRHRPYHEPWQITDETDAKLITEALDAAVAVARKLEVSDADSLGFDVLEDNVKRKIFEGKKVPCLVPDGKGAYDWTETPLPAFVKDEYPSPKFNNDILIHRVKSLPKISCNIWSRVFHFPIAVNTNKEDGVPVYPTIIVIAGFEDNILIPVMTDEEDKDGQNMLTSLANNLCEQLEKRPTEIIVDNEETKSYMEDFCKKTGIKLSFSMKRNQKMDTMGDFLQTQMMMMF